MTNPDNLKVAMTPEEADVLMSYVTLATVRSVCDFACKVQKAYSSRRDNMHCAPDAYYIRARTLTAIWNAGRIQGIRSERQRRHATATQKHPAVAQSC